MFDSYGNKQIYLVEPEKIDYTIPHIGYEDHFRTYYVCSASGVKGFTVGQMNRENAERFAKYNNLKLIIKAEQYRILEETPSMPWPEEDIYNY